MVEARTRARRAGCPRVGAALRRPAGRPPIGHEVAAPATVMVRLRGNGRHQVAGDPGSAEFTADPAD